MGKFEKLASQMLGVSEEKYKELKLDWEIKKSGLSKEEKDKFNDDATKKIMSLYNRFMSGEITRDNAPNIYESLLNMMILQFTKNEEYELVNNLKKLLDEGK